MRRATATSVMALFFVVVSLAQTQNSDMYQGFRIGMDLAETMAVAGGNLEKGRALCTNPPKHLSDKEQAHFASVCPKIERTLAGEPTEWEFPKEQLRLAFDKGHVIRVTDFNGVIHLEAQTQAGGSTPAPIMPTQISPAQQTQATGQVQDVAAASRAMRQAKTAQAASTAPPESPQTAMPVRQSTHTTFQGFWVGMSIDEFRATPKGAAIANAYRYLANDFVYHPGEKDCNVLPHEITCQTWRYMNDTIGWAFYLTDPNQWTDGDAYSKGPSTNYDFNEHKLVSISYSTNEEGETGFKKVVGQLTAKYGKSTRMGTLRNANDFGAVYYSHYAQWDRPDGTCISIETRFELGYSAVVKFFVPEKLKTATSNPY